jgi:hypothetical protein
MAGVRCLALHGCGIGGFLPVTIMEIKFAEGARIIDVTAGTLADTGLNRRCGPMRGPKSR